MRKLIICWYVLVGWVILGAIFDGGQLLARKIVRAYSKTGNADCALMYAVPTSGGVSLDEIRLNCDGKEYTSDDTRLLVYFLEHKQSKINCELYDSGKAFCEVPEAVKKK